MSCTIWHRHSPAGPQNINKTRCFAAKQKRWTASKKLGVIAVTSSSEYPEDCRVGASVSREGRLQDMVWYQDCGGSGEHHLIISENIRVITPVSMRWSDCSGHHQGFIWSYSILAGDEVTPLIVCLTYFLSPGAYFLMIITLAMW